MSLILLKILSRRGVEPRFEPKVRAAQTAHTVGVHTYGVDTYGVS